jgi:hypothetical protein
MRVGWHRRNGLDEIGVLLGLLASLVSQLGGLLLLLLLQLLLMLLLLQLRLIVACHVTEAWRAVLKHHLSQLLVTLLGLLDLDSESLTLELPCLLLWSPGLLLQIGLALTASRASRGLLALLKYFCLLGRDVGRDEGLLREGMLLLLGGLQLLLWGAF